MEHKTEIISQIKVAFHVVKKLPDDLKGKISIKKVRKIGNNK
jgi:hypothetical protein